MKAIIWDGRRKGMKFEARDIPDDLKGKGRSGVSMVESACRKPTKT